MKRIVTLLATLLLTLGMLGMPALAGEGVTPSTNADNKTAGWAHFEVLEKTPTSVKVEFVSTRSFASCFEYRIDGAETTDTRDNFNDDIDDGLWPFTCVNDSSTTHTLEGVDEFVEIRMVFGAERDERFDWTKVHIAGITSPSDGDTIEVHETLELAATDRDAASGGVQWAVRADGSGAGQGTVAGNVDGYSDGSTWAGGEFSASLDISAWEPGEYYFVFNPRAGDRYVVTFYVAETTLVKDLCKDGGWQDNFPDGTYRNQGQCVSESARNR
jgi:hypothetical protein